MGSYTTNLKFYKPAATEFVDVDVQLNANWQIGDKAVKQLLEYEFTTGQSPDVATAVDRAKFYKWYSNSLQMWFKTGSFFWQDPGSQVDTWVAAKSLLIDGWVEHHDFPLGYRIVQNSGSSTAEVEWTGAIWQGNAFIDNNTNTVVMNSGAMPTSIRPTVSKYFQMSAGNTSTDYGICRLFFSSNGSIEFKRYGVNPASNGDECRIEFTGVKYNIEIGA